MANADVQSDLNENYVVLLADINKNSDIAAKYKVFGTPTTLFLDAGGKEIHKVEGYVSSDEFMKILKGI